MAGTATSAREGTGDADVTVPGSRGASLQQPASSVFLDPTRAPVRRPQPEDYPFPIRDGCSVTPLIEAADMFPDLERAVLGAERTVYLAFRIFDPTTRTRSSQARALGLQDWRGIIQRKVNEGVVVRLLLTDFEPVMAHDLHSLSWSSFHAFRDMAAELPKDKLDGFEMVVIQHDGEVGWGIRQLMRLPLRFTIRRVIRELAGRGGDLDALVYARPGLWRYHRLANGQLVFRPGPPPRLWPSTYHQKFAVIDDRVAILGGIDVNERRWDTPSHRQRADQTWHDVSVRLEGPAVADCSEHFRRLWNREMPRFRAIASEWMSGADRELVLDPLDPIASRAPVPGSAPGGRARVQVLRTLSRRDPSPFAVGPRAHVRELMIAHRKIIYSAERLLYIEAQFFRYQRAARWIVQRARQRPELRVILVVPNAPEEVAFEGDTNVAHQHGEYLQARAIDYLRRRLGGRVGVFSLAKRAPASEAEKELAAQRGTAFGSGVIHVHSKLVIADDVSCLVSSANINGRSFKWDTEFGMLWQDAENVCAFRQRLWQQLFALSEPPDWPLGEALEHFGAIAARNIRVAPQERQGFIVPHQVGRTRRFGRRYWFVPDDLV